MRIYNEINGFINILKPAGPTSSDIVSRLKRILNVKKIGHMGTLDPLAGGVLPIGIGKANRLFEHLTYKKKSYRAIFTFGKETDTADSEGKVIAQTTRIPTFQEIESALQKFRGVILQTPPKYSALKINGRKAYELAREEADFEIKKREVTIYKFELIKCEKDGISFVFDIECSGGTYIRSLCTELSEELGSKAYMAMLIRTSSGDFDINKSCTIQDLEEQGFEKYLISMNDILSTVPKIEIDLKDQKDLLNGVPIVVSNIDTDKIAVYHNNLLYGLGTISNSVLKICTYLKIDD